MLMQHKRFNLAGIGCASGRRSAFFSHADLAAFAALIGLG